LTNVSVFVEIWLLEEMHHPGRQEKAGIAIRGGMVQWHD